MFESLSDRFDGIFTKLRGKGRLSEADVDEVLREIRLALLEADVNLSVVRGLQERIRERAVGEDLSKALNPALQVKKIVLEELTATLGGETLRITYSSKPPTVVLMAGLQGSGKTTNSAKLARWFKGQGRNPILVGADLQRPAAVAQLRTLAERVPELLLAVSCSKNFGLYRERTGALAVISANNVARTAVATHQARLARRMYSMPPDHGVVEYTGASAGNGADGILRMPWHANLSHNEHVEWCSQGAGHFGGHRNATAREAEHDNSRPRCIARQHRGKVGTGLAPVSEQDGHGRLRSGDSAQRTDGMAACLSDKSRRLATTDSCDSSRAWLTVYFPTACQNHPDSTQ